MVTILSHNSPGAEIRAALDVAADVLGVDVCWLYRGDFHFRLSDEWTVSLAPETAGRLRVGTWRCLVSRDRKWVRIGDSSRLADLLRDARETALQPT